VQGHLILTNCLEDEVTRPAIERALTQNELLWLDLDDTSPATIAVLREVFKLHPPAIEDAQEFHQRPKIEDYDDFVPLKRLITLYRLLDSLFPYLAAMDDRIDELQDAIFDNPEKEQLSELFAMKRQLVDLRKLVTPQRDMVSSMLGPVSLAGMTADTERYIRGLYDHLIRISDMVDS
jgi:Mg2+ and Co2+ transporter CorA